MNKALTTYVAFLRGINVGGHRKIPMTELRKLIFAMSSDENVQTYIASGNAIFRATGDAVTMAELLRSAIQESFGFDVPVLVLTDVAMENVLKSCPFPDAIGNQAHAYLCFGAPTLNDAAIAALQAPSETVTVVGQTVWLHAPEGVGRSKLAAKLEFLIGVEATARNLNTLRKMAEMAVA